VPEQKISQKYGIKQEFKVSSIFHRLKGGFFLKKLKEIYLKSTIIQFVLSYIAILFTSLLICLFGFQIVLNAMEKVNHQIFESMIGQSKTLLDKELSSIRKMSLLIARDSYIFQLSSDKVKNPEFYLDAKKATDRLSDIYYSSNIYLLNNVYVYMGNYNSVLVNGTMYRDEIFSNNYSDDKSEQLIKWREASLNFGKHYPQYIAENNNIKYIQPIYKDYSSPVMASVIFEIDEKNLKSILNIGQDMDKISIFIKNEQGNVIFENDNVGVIEKISNMELDKNGFIKEKENMIIYTTSDEGGWQFIIVVPEKLAMTQLNQLKITIMILVSFAVAIGSLISWVLAIRNAGPINDVMNMVNRNYTEVGNIRDMGEMVSNIISKNQLLLEEMERERPLLQLAFLQRVVRGEFISELELNTLSNKVGVSIDGNNYNVVAFRIFSNNDFYDADPQTIEEVRIISFLIQNKLKEYIETNIWFYEIDYLTTVVIIDNTSKVINVKKVLSEVHKHILNEYHVNQSWGIGEPSDSLSKVWRSCEEAKSALVHVIKNEKNSIAEYSQVIDKQKGNYYPDLFEERLINSVKSGDINNTKNLIDMLRKENFETRNITRKMFLKLNTHILNTILSLNYMDIVTEQIESLNQAIIEYVEGAPDKYFAVLNSIFEELCKKHQSTKKSVRKNMIAKMMEYVCNNYMDSNLGLSMVATEFSISEGYVSIIFKEQGGVNFADYVENKRIDEACELLKNHKITINDIAIKVGYNSVQSFRRAFKKVNGVSPRELRKEI
jgi:two-component system, response regulator YesN